MKKYFENVNNVQSKLFGNSYVYNLKKNIKILPMLSGDLNKCPIGLLSDFLKSDVYVVFGSTYIKGELIGGCDITLQLFESGELKKMIDEATS